MSNETPGAGIGSDDADTKRGPLGRWVDSAIKNPDRVYRAMFYVAMLFFLVTTLFPFYWLLVLALTPNNLIADMGLVPNGFNPQVFVAMFERVPFHYYMFNSFVLGITTTVLVLLIASLAGYVFGRLRFPGKGVLMLGILAISYFPPAAFLIPLFELFTGNTSLTVGMVTISTPDLFNTPAPMVFPFSALFLPLSIFILTTFYGQIPDGLEDAARVEGTTRLGALFRVIVPLSAPGVATAGVLTFISVYNEFFFSFLMNNGEADSWAPIVAGILKYQGQFDTPYNLMAAASIVGVLPVAILVIIAQERIVSGLTAGALKE
ncbi:MULTISPECIES: carbohydrate ABC transporter permease [unclassified Haloferax]|uniref:carbohydrate ABC transporter permease n=1 Tax=unclassified Haloferax TaxID=2625095 RepID=UPI002875F2AC|nr:MULTISPECIES: carbohydrate ABC transporter permease [unclassified Haloferax]MDS0241112.1 carbohydrate ABC transporter permease [Haloferax sp. S2CR25]MDS0444233.1 carbohydrate ABC transporter permease [Haloferax sp. S2CR25-2]